MVSNRELGELLIAEIDRGYDVVTISDLAFDFYQKSGRESSPELSQILLQLIAVQEGLEFELSEREIRRLAEKLASPH